MAMIRTLIHMLQSEMTAFARRVDTTETRLTRLEQRHDYAIAQLHDATHEALTGLAALERARKVTTPLAGPVDRNVTATGLTSDGDGG